jgi:Na+/H+ antiporter NhaD/arsenite permease-like protein
LFWGRAGNQQEALIGRRWGRRTEFSRNGARTAFDRTNDDCAHGDSARRYRGVGLRVGARLDRQARASGNPRPQSIDVGSLTRHISWANGTTIAAIVVFVATYLVVAIGKLPGYQLDRAGAALVGASFMVGLGVVSLDQAFRAIDFDAITLLLGMMIVVANLRLSGFFRLVSNFVVTRARHPLVLLLAIVVVAGSLSAFLVNDTICLVMTPLVLTLLRRLKRDPIPYVLAIPMASNVGSVATITGNPQNMIIASLSGISYGAFAMTLWPVAAVGVFVTALLIALFYHREFLTSERLPAVAVTPARYHRSLVFKSVLVTLAMMFLFFAGQPVAKVAIVCGALLLLTRRVKADKVYREIDWPLLLTMRVSTAEP